MASAGRPRSVLTQNIKARMQHALSDDEIHKLLPGVPITLYKDLDEKSLDQITDKNGRGMILFVTEETPTTITGHWLCVFKQPQGIMMFDPYGGVKGDPWYKDSTFVEKEDLVELDQTRPELETIIRKAGFRPLFNIHELQKDRRDINTCGRHCAVRLWNDHMSNNDYVHMLWQHGPSADATVTALTDAVLKGGVPPPRAVP